MSLRVTWLLPIKDGMPFLPETLASIEAQTYQDWEILAWDNGSTDGTLQELKRWIPSRLPGRIVTDCPLGLGLSLAQMVLCSSTELCARIDADDINMPDRLERQVAFLRENPQIAVVGSQQELIDQAGQSLGMTVPPLPLTHHDMVHGMLYRNGISHPTVLFRRSAVLESGNYHDVGPINVEDYDLWLRMAVQHQLANLNIPLVRYRIHDRSTTQMAIAKNRLTRALDDRLCEHAPGLYGCRVEEARALRERSHPSAIRVLRRIAKHLQESQPPAVDVLHSASFLTAGRALTAPQDVVSRLALAGFDRRRAAVLQELACLGAAMLKNAVMRLGGPNAVAEVRRARRRWS